MTSSYKVSVAMAAYNGGKYIGEQLHSILPQLKQNDELVISLDPSGDATEQIIKDFAKTYPQVKLVRGPGAGAVKNFENAIRHCTGEIIFLCDQDDVWYDQKVKTCLSAFTRGNPSVILHDASIADKDLRIKSPSFMQAKGTSPGILKNIIKNSYIGCCMAFRKEMLAYILPFPEKLPMHDQWIGILGERFGTVRIIQEPLIYHRRHGENTSGDTHSSIPQMIKWRMSLLKEYRKRLRKVKRENG